VGETHGCSRGETNSPAGVEQNRQLKRIEFTIDFNAQTANFNLSEESNSSNDSSTYHKLLNE